MPAEFGRFCREATDLSSWATSAAMATPIIQPLSLLASRT